MSRFNKVTKISPSVTENRAGGQAFKQDAKMAFVSMLLTSFVEDQFYRSSEEQVSEMSEFVKSISDKEFVAKAAIFARTKYGMRSVSHLVAGELAPYAKGQEWGKRFYDKIVYRVDDINNILAYWINKNVADKTKWSLPKAMQKGLAKAFDKFDKYQLSKYRQESAQVSLVDAVNLLHPRPVSKNAEALKLLVQDKLRSKDTWETKISGAGQKAETEEEKAELKKEEWAKLIKEKKLGYMALLKNLRNICQDAPDMIDKVCEMLVEREAIKKSLILPFRFYTAYQQLKQEGVPNKVLKAVAVATDIALDNIPKFDGKTLVVLDTSGSMEGRPEEIGKMFSAVILKANDDADFMTFSNDAEYSSVNTADSTISIMEDMSFESGGTNFHAIFETAKKAYDRVIILSDMQGWMGYDSPAKEFAEYKRKYKCDPVVYSFDLQGLGSLQFPERNVYCLAGFSDKIFDVMKLLETDKNALIHEIEKIVL